jgi:predicted DNA-binding protein
MQAQFYTKWYNMKTRNKPKKVRVSVYMDKELAEYLLVRSNATGGTTASYLRYLIIEDMKKQ